MASPVWYEAVRHTIEECFKSPVFSGSVGALVGYLITSRTQFTLERKRIFNQFSAELRESFYDELLAVADREKRDGLYSILDSGLRKHFKAAVKFRTCLGPITRRRFDRAWQNYAGHKNVKFSLVDEPPFPMPSLAAYHDRLEFSQPREQEEVRQEIITKLEKILSFARPK